MRNKVTKVPYIAIAVNSLEKAASFFSGTFGGTLSEKGKNESESYRDVIVKIGDFNLYLMEPTDEESVIAMYIAKHGEGVHHICFCYPDYKLAIRELRNNHLNILGDENSIYSFIHPKDAHGVLIELAPEYNEPRAWD